MPTEIESLRGSRTRRPCGRVLSDLFPAAGPTADGAKGRARRSRRGGATGPVAQSRTRSRLAGADLANVNNRRRRRVTRRGIPKSCPCGPTGGDALAPAGRLRESWMRRRRKEWSRTSLRGGGDGRRGNNRSRRTRRATRHVGSAASVIFPDNFALVRNTNRWARHFRTRRRHRARRHTGRVNFVRRVAAGRQPAALAAHSDRNRIAARHPNAPPLRARPLRLITLLRGKNLTKTGLGKGGGRSQETTDLGRLFGVRKLGPPRSFSHLKL